VDNLEQEDMRNLVQNLESSLLSVNEQGNIMPKTPKAALVAVQAYLLTTQPAPGEEGMTTKARDIGTPEVYLGKAHTASLYRTQMDARDLATYKLGPGEGGQGPIEI
jgi:hypothetical protein